jgi:nucleoredoxin
MKKVFVLTLAALTIGSLLNTALANEQAAKEDYPLTDAYNGKGPWILMDYDKAVARAKQENKDMLVLFTGSDWCSGCKILEKTILSHAAFIENVTNDFVLLLEDRPNSGALKSKIPEPLSLKRKELAQKLNITCVPTLLLLTTSGDIYLRTRDLRKTPAEYAKALHDYKNTLPALKAKLAKIRNPATPTPKKLELMDQILSAAGDEAAETDYADFVQEIIRLDKDNKAGLQAKYMAKIAIKKAYSLNNLQKTVQSLDNAMNSYNYTGENLLQILNVKIACLNGLGDSRRSYEALKIAAEAAKGSDTELAKRLTEQHATMQEYMNHAKQAAEIRSKLDSGNIKGIERAKLLDEYITQTRLANYRGINFCNWRFEKPIIAEIMRLDPSNKSGITHKYIPSILTNNAKDMILQNNWSAAYPPTAKLLKLYPPEDPAKLQKLILQKAQLMMADSKFTNKEIASVIEKALQAKPDSPNTTILKHYLTTLNKQKNISWLHGHLGPELIKADGTKADPSVLQNNKLIGLYFSAHWCGPCRRFTPYLVRFRDQMQKEGHPFEVVFVSRDQSDKEMMNYMRQKQMKWYAIPFELQRLRDSLARHYGVRGIPCLVIIDNKGKIITTKGRNDLISGKDNATIYNNWISPKPKQQTKQSKISHT